MTTTPRLRALSLALAACLLLAACGSDTDPTATGSDNGSDTTDPTTSDPTTSDPTTSDPTTTPGGTAQDAAVRMADMAFSPASVTVTAGSTVTWTNDDTLPHTVSFGDDGPAASDVLEPGDTFAVTFDEPGVYAYVCTLHPGMEGTVEVTGAGDDGNADASAPQRAPAATAVRGQPGTTAPAAAPPLPGVGTPGVDVVLGEWALVPSVTEAPPGQTTFRFRNLGTVPHALRIRTPGSGRDRREWRSETIAPGASGLLVADLAAGTYEVDCPVEDGHGEHDELGMEMVFTVRDGAAALAPLPGADTPAQPQAGPAAVDIASFAFAPAELHVPVGTEVVWTNSDPAPHTATGDAFDTGHIEPGATAARTFDTPGTYAYVCAIHPSMRGRVVVDA